MKPEISSPLRLGKLVYPDWQSPNHIKEFNSLIMNLIHTPDLNRLCVSVSVRHGKSRMFSILSVAYFLLKFPSKNVILLSATSDLATEFASQVRTIIETYGHLNDVYLDRRWRAKDRFKINRYGGGLFSGGQGCSVAGRPANYLVCDDIYRNMEESNSANSRNKIAEWFSAEAMSRLEPDGKVCVVGSRRHLEDLTGHLLQLNREIDDKRYHWIETLFPAISKDGKALWEERFSIKKLEQIRAELELQGQGWIFESLYQNSPINSSANDWSPNIVSENLLLTRIFPAQYDKIIISIDPAVGKSDKGDDTAIIVAGYINDKCYIIDGVLGNIDVNQIETFVTNFRVIYNPAAIICEVNGFAEILGNNIANKNPNTNVIKFTSKSDKLERIRCLITPWLYKNGIKIKDCPMGRTLFSQFQQFPTSAKDDGLDSISLNIGAFNYITHKTTEVYNNIRYT